MQLLKLENAVITTSTHTGVFTDTLKVAEIFDKSHKNVLATMNRLIKNGAIGRLNFELSSYVTKQNKRAKMYQLNREGFLLLTTSFTGANADRWRGAVIKLFIKQEEELTEWRRSRQSLKYIHPNYTDQIKLLCELLKMEGSKFYAHTYSTIQRQINKAITLKPTPRGNAEYRETLSTEQLADIKWLENYVADTILHKIRTKQTGREIRAYIKMVLENFYHSQARQKVA